MKYIRTKDRIVEIKKMTLDDKLTGDYIHERTADTIEELCDEFVLGHTLVSYKEIEALVLPRDRKYIYGAIWTDKGLIYVAKMNDKGVLELL